MRQLTDLSKSMLYNSSYPELLYLLLLTITRRFIKPGKNEKVFFQQGFLILSLCIIFVHIKTDNESFL